jgi:hypothetical protein
MVSTARISPTISKSIGDNQPYFVAARVATTAGALSWVA